MKRNDDLSTENRRRFLQIAAAAGMGTLLSGCESTGPMVGADSRQTEEEKGEVSPSEDLMREHGVLKRVLLVYNEAIRRIDAHEDLPPEPLADASKIIRTFVEDYHEKLEEDYLFPRFRKANVHVDLVGVLIEQHRAGRRVTDITLSLVNQSSLKDADDRRRLAESMRQFIRMYNPHEAREDTVLFPAFRKIVSANEYDALGEDFETKEHQLFGEDGFDRMVDRVARIEKALGIYDLKQFTPSM